MIHRKTTMVKTINISFVNIELFLINLLYVVANKPYIYNVVLDVACFRLTLKNQI